MNQYQQLQQASKIFLNPTMDQIIRKIPLEDVCYYVIDKLPQDQLIWEQIEQASQTKNFDIIELTTKAETKSLKLLTHNLELAKKNQDIDYLVYLLSFRPKIKKLTFKVKKMIQLPESITTAFNLGEEYQFEPVEFRQLIHQYIQRHQLQKENLIILDQILQEILSSTEKQLEYFEFLKLYKAKYQTKT